MTCEECERGCRKLVPATSSHWPAKDGQPRRPVMLCVGCKEDEDRLEQRADRNLVRRMIAKPCPYASIEDLLREQQRHQGQMGRAHPISQAAGEALIERWRRVFAEAHEEALACPGCGKAHLDEGEWAQRPHTTHRCVDDAAGKGCGKEWTLARYAFGVDMTA